jgi:ribonuclease HII
VNLLAGVDEAGFGPILGPLVVGGVAMVGPEGVCPWKALKKHVARKKQEKGKVRVADSKKVNQGPHGLRHLEETALVFWTALHGELPGSLADWLARLGADVAHLARCPWYQDLALPLPLLADADWLRLQAELVARALRKAEVQLVHVALRAVDVEEWNALIADTDNKSRAHFRAYGDVLGRVLASVPADRCGRVVADRCGGRTHYAGDLARLCPGATVVVVDEQPAASSYRVERANGAITVTFAERGEDRAFPTALASCFAKYLRELMVECINRWFCARVPGLQPTAGYHTDGHRFLADLTPHLGTLAAPRERLVRVR